MRMIFTAAALTLASIAPAYAADVTTCDEASITMVSDAVKNSTDTGKAGNAVGDVNKAKELMAAGKKEECVTALNSAMMQLK